MIRTLLAAALALIAAGCAMRDGAPADATAPVAFRCTGGKALSVAFAGTSARLTDPSGRSVRLAQQPSGSGIRYAGPDGELRGKGPDMTWTPANGAPLECRDAAAAPAPAALAGTRWQLVQFQSSDDSVGTIRPSDPTRYTMELGADGRAFFRLDCNRANATWESWPDGRIRFGPGAMTRAACPPGAMDTRIAADLARLRTFTPEGEMLHLALEADGGIYSWRRLP